MEAMRREAEIRAAAREGAFRRIAEIPNPPPFVQERFEFANWVIVRGVHRPTGRNMPASLSLDRIGQLLEEEPDQADWLIHEVAAETFDPYLFGPSTGPESVRAYFGKLLERRLNELALYRELTLDQRKKLLLAGRGDIKRLFDRIETARSQFLVLRSDVRRCMDFLATLDPLRQELRRGPFGDGSLFAKTLLTLRRRR
jgi:hypothetical protein